MATKLQTYTTPSDDSNNRLTNENGEFYSRTMLERLKDNVIVAPYGKKMPIPKNAGATISARRLELASNITSAITEGTTPDGIDLTINKVSGTVAQYGAWTKITDYLADTGLDPIVTETAEMFGESAALSMDAIIMSVLNAGTTRQFAGSKTARSTMTAGNTISSTEILAARKTLATNNVPQIKLPNGRKGWLALAHPTVINQVMALSDWKTLNSYVDTANFEQGIVGQMYGIYFKECNVAPTFTDGGSAGATLAGCVTPIIGADAFAVADVSGSSKPEIIVCQQADTSNPMGLYSTVAWKTLFTSFILNQKCVLCLETLNA